MLRVQGDDQSKWAADVLTIGPQVDATVDRTPPHPDPLPEGEATRAGGRALRVALWLIAIAVGMALDARVANFVHGHAIDDFLHAHAIIRQTMKAPGEYWFTLVVAILAGWLH